MENMIMIMMLSISLMFTTLTHPLSMGLTLIIQTIMMSMLTGLMLKTFWMSYILLITMLSGMLVLFIYMSSIASNEKFHTKMSLIILISSSFTLSCLMMIFQNKMIFSNYFGSLEMIPLFNKEILSLNKMFNYEYLSITLMMVLYLLLSMISASHLVNVLEGPMCMKTSYE